MSVIRFWIVTVFFSQSSATCDTGAPNVDSKIAGSTFSARYSTASRSPFVLRYVSIPGPIIAAALKPQRMRPMIAPAFDAPKRSATYAGNTANTPPKQEAMPKVANTNPIRGIVPPEPPVAAMIRDGTIKHAGAAVAKRSRHFLRPTLSATMPQTKRPTVFAPARAETNIAQKAGVAISGLETAKQSVISTFPAAIIPRPAVELPHITPNRYQNW
mmetsp:Transcript_10259/g.25153  ORF Transcript_10259/g.25153 Transcript_10259/m.25153 type:complete len:215 (+) Transcript_10259:345-989(+)